MNFEYSGHYYGVPLWIGFDDNDELVIEVKHPWLNPVFDVAEVIEQFILQNVMQEEEPCFQFTIDKQVWMDEAGKVHVSDITDDDL
jgi:hypothetical protein